MRYEYVEPQKWGNGLGQTRWQPRIKREDGDTYSYYRLNSRYSGTYGWRTGYNARDYPKTYRSRRRAQRITNRRIRQTAKTSWRKESSK